MLLQGQSLYIAACAALLLALFTLIRRYLTLRHIPGPFLASWSDLWLLRVMRNGTYREKAIELDNKYGKVVRYGPSRVLFSDVEAIPVVYGTTRPYQKATSYQILTPRVNGRLIPSLLSDRDENEVSAIKRHINHVFSNTAVLDFEHHIDHTITNLIKVLQTKGPKLNLQTWFSYFSFDTICRIGFSDDTDMMSRGEDVGDTLLGGRLRFQHWGQWLAIPQLERLLFKTRFTASVAKPELITSIAAKRVQERVEKGGAAGGYQDILDRYFQAQEKAPSLFDIRRIIALTLTLVHAGSETTGHSLTIVLYTLLKHPHVYARLRKEIDDANLSFPPPFAEVVQLKYLEACIKEAQRTVPLSRGPVEREVPSQGTTISGVFIPGGTVVSVNQNALAFHPAVFDPFGKYDVHEFIPDRWLDLSPSQLALMDRALFAFSYGKRACLGVHLAWCELRKTLPAILMRFDVELQDKKFELETEKMMVGMVIGQGLPAILTERGVVEKN